MHCSPKHSVSVFLVFCQALYIDQASLLKFCSKYQYFSCFPWSGLYFLLVPLSHPISLFLVICFKLPITQTPDNLNFFGFSLRGLSYWESTVCKIWNFGHISNLFDVPKVSNPWMFNSGIQGRVFGTKNVQMAHCWQLKIPIWLSTAVWTQLILLKSHLKIHEPSIFFTEERFCDTDVIFLEGNEWHCVWKSHWTCWKEPSADIRTLKERD